MFPPLRIPEKDVSILNIREDILIHSATASVSVFCTDRKPFLDEGEVIRQAGEYRYFLRIDKRLVCYNQRNMKPLFGKSFRTGDDYIEAEMT